MIPKYVKSTVKHGGGSVIGCFAESRVGDLYRVRGTLNQNGYHSILQSHAMPSETRTSDIDADTETHTSPQRNTKPLRDGPLTAAQRRINIRRKSNTPQLRLGDQEGHRPITNQTNWQETPPSNHAIKTAMAGRSISNHTTPNFQPPNHMA
ncbi:hypothetical protein SRHO_G00194970 [Serrasalmus rhombeus]